MIVNRIYLEGVKHSPKLELKIKELTIISGVTEVLKKTTGTVIICEFETTKKELDNIYKYLKKSTGADSVRSETMEYDQFIKTVTKPVQIEVKPEPDNIFDKPGTIWNIDGIPHEKINNKWEPINK